jgi:hypothetical protein
MHMIMKRLCQDKLSERSVALLIHWETDDKCFDSEGKESTALVLAALHTRSERGHFRRLSWEMGLEFPESHKQIFICKSKNLSPMRSKSFF